MTTKTVIPISPKVFTGLLTAIGCAAVSGIAASIEPSWFTGLGALQAPTFALATGVVSSAAAWFKKEVAAEEVTVTSTPAAPADSAPAPAVPEAATTSASVPVTIVK